MTNARTWMTVALLAAVPALPAQVYAAQETVATADVDQVLAKATTYLKSKQRPDGGWHDEQQPPAITALVLRAVVGQPGLNSKTDWVDKGYNRLLSFQVEDGGIYRDLLANYNTAISVSALTAANDERFKPNVEKAVAYLRGLQWTGETRPEHDDPTKGQQVVSGEADPFYGGWGYGGRSRGAGRPDLSNAHLALEALHDAGVDPSDPAMQRALTFLSRCQNNSETNDQPWAGNDGGFVYGPSADRTGESMAGDFTDDAGERRLRSYGSMTYAGLKSMVYAGLTKDDSRVRAAYDWVTKNWTVTENPGMRARGPEQARFGLFYYYLTMGRALSAYGQPTVPTPAGDVDWRRALIDELARQQRPDGSWSGEKRWMEDDPILATAYATIALEAARADLKARPLR